MQSWPLLGRVVGWLQGMGLIQEPAPGGPSPGVAAGSRELNKGRKITFWECHEKLIFEFGALAAPPVLSVPDTLFWGLGFGMSRSIMAPGFVHGNGEK